MTAYRLTKNEFLYLAIHMAVSRVPVWCDTESDLLDTETIQRSLRKKEFLLTDTKDEELVHPVISYLFKLMRETVVWVSFTEDALLYWQGGRYVLLERSATEAVRLIPFENAATCFAYLEECTYWSTAVILFDDAVPEAEKLAEDLKNRMEAYFEQ